MEHQLKIISKLSIGKTRTIWAMYKDLRYFQFTLKSSLLSHNLMAIKSIDTTAGVRDKHKSSD